MWDELVRRVNQGQDMRAVIAMSILLGCSQRSLPEEAETGAFKPEDAVHETDDAIRVDVHRREVPLQQMPIVAEVMSGLPMSGLADITVDLTVPKVDGKPRYGQTTGSIAFACPKGCTLGDDRTKLSLRDLGDVDFNHLTLGTLDARAEVRDGHVNLTKWELVSTDLTFHARLQIDLVDALADSKIDGCLWFKPDPSLLARDPKMHALISTTGATPDADGVFQIKISGRIGARKYLAQQCKPT